MTQRTELFADPATRAVLGTSTFLDRLDPDGPAARRLARDLPLYRPGEREAWRREIARLDRLDRWTSDHPDDHHTLRDALGELPAIGALLDDLQSGRVLGDSELFQFKRFAFFARRAVERGPLSEEFAGIRSRLDSLLERLHPGGSDHPRFRLADELAPELAEARSALRGARDRLRRRRDRLEAQIIADMGGSFDLTGTYHPPETAAPGNDDRLERSDDAWRLSDDEFDECRSTVDDLERRVERAEHEARRDLCGALRSEAEWLNDLAERLAALDLRLAKVRLRRSVNGCWPRWSATATSPDPASDWPTHPVLSITAGRHPSLEETEGAIQPVDVHLGPQPAVVTGPNMGGKSVLLALAGLCQWAAQHALPVPADDCAFRPVESIVYVGSELPGTSSADQGLSSFGREVRRLVEARERARPPSLWLLDELGRGTHPRDGAAFAADVLRRLDRTGHRVLAATHFPAVADVSRASLFRVRGLDRDGLADATDPAEALDGFHRRMDYQPRPVEAASIPRDARTVARALGWPPDDSTGGG